MSESTNYASGDETRRLWQRCKEQMDEIERLRAGIREAVVAFRYAPLHDVWWLIGEECDRNITVYEHLLSLLPEGEQAGGDDE